MKMRINVLVAVVFNCILLGFSNVHAQSDSTFVATTGVDTSTCGARNSPCRTFAAALINTNADGEVMALDSGVYSGNVRIFKSITLTAAPGVRAEMVNDGNDDLLFINGGKTVIVRNLYIHPIPSGQNILSNGILVGDVGFVSIENCVVSDWGGNGIEVSSDVGPQDVSISDTIARRNGNDGIVIALFAQGTSAVSINHCRMISNGRDGLDVHEGIAVARDSIAANNSVGFDVGGELTIDNCEGFNNFTPAPVDGVGVYTSTGAKVIVSNSIFTNNYIGFHNDGLGTFYSLGDNFVRSNVTNTEGVITVLAGN